MMHSRDRCCKCKSSLDSSQRVLPSPSRPRPLPLPQQQAAAQQLSWGSRSTALGESFVVLGAQRLAQRARSSLLHTSLPSSVPGLDPSLGQQYASRLELARYAAAALDDDSWPESSAQRPMCLNCFDAVTKLLQDELESLDQWGETLQGEERAAPVAKDGEESSRLQSLLSEQSELVGLLQRVSSERAALRAESSRIDEEERSLALEEELFLLDDGAFRASLWRFAEERDSLMRSAEQRSKELESWERSPHAFSDAFHIIQRGRYGSINGYRLGRRPDERNAASMGSSGESGSESPNLQVEWEEVNTAWGQAALLLSALAHSAKLEFSRHHVVPAGSSSVIQELSHRANGDRTVANEWTLHHDPAGQRRWRGGGGNAERGVLRGATSLLGHVTSSIGGAVSALGGGLYYDSYALRPFNAAMVAFLVCLDELERKAKSEESGSQMDLAAKLKPIVIGADGVATINGFSIEFGGSGDEERWTKALRWILGNLKWLLVWSAKRAP